MKVYIVRHGQTNSNIESKLLGITDEDINEMGIRQAKKAKENLRNKKIDVCFSSPLKRTKHTSSIICEESIPIIIDERLLERGFGVLEGGAYNEKYTHGFWDFYLNKNDYGVEPLKCLFSGTKTFLEYLKKNYMDKNVLIVSHAATIRALHFNIVGFDKDTNMLSFLPDNAQVFEYELKE